MNALNGPDGVLPEDGRPASAGGQEPEYGEFLDLLQTRVFMLLRRSVAALLREILFAFNRFMVSTFTVRGLSWRFESLRTGLALADVIRRHNAIHPVEQVFLIHRSTGLLLCEHGRKPGPARDPDMVSGMLTAVRDFVSDSFRGEGTVDLHTIEVSGITVYVESSPDAILAGVMRGPATAEVRTVFRTVLRQVNDRFSPELKDFRGDTSPLKAARPMLKSCLRIESLGLNRKLAPVTVVFLALLAACAAWCLAYSSFWGSRWNSFVTEMRHEHGVVVLRASGAWGHFTIEGLRDPLSVDPAIRLQHHGLPPDRVNMRWTLYHDLGAPFVVARAREILAAPDTITFHVRSGTLFLAGSAPASWLDRFKLQLPEISGIGVIDISAVALDDADMDGRWRAFVDALGSEPGIVVVKAERTGNGFALSGLRDPLAQDPDRILREKGPPPSDVSSDWHPFLSLDPGLVLLRSKLVLEPPASVRLSLEGSTLAAEGVAPHAWIRTAAAAARALPGVMVFDSDALQDSDRLKLLAAADETRKLRFDFMAGSPSLWPGQNQRIDELIARSKALAEAADAADAAVTVELVGHTNSSGDPVQERSQSEAFCRLLLDMLPPDRVDRSMFRIRGEGAAAANIPEQERHPGHNRIVTINAVIKSR